MFGAGRRGRPSFKALGNAGDIGSPRRRRSAAGIHFRRKAQPASCKSCRPYSVSGAAGLWRQVCFCKVRNNSPRTPLILPRSCAASAGQGERKDYDCGGLRRPSRRCRPQGFSKGSGCCSSPCFFQSPAGLCFSSRVVSIPGSGLVFPRARFSTLRGPQPAFRRSRRRRSAAGFTSGVKRSRRRAGPAVRTVSLVRTGVRAVSAPMMSRRVRLVPPAR